MNVSNINQIFNEKMQEINSRLPVETNVNNKFQSLLEQAQLKNKSEATSTLDTEKVNNKSNDNDINSILKTMISTQSLLNSNSSFSQGTSSGIFPTSNMNSTINILQQTQLLNAIKKNLSTDEK